MLKCCSCLYQTDDAKGFLNHVKDNHRNDSNLIVHCPYCNAPYRKFDSLDTHIKRHHKTVNEQDSLTKDNKSNKNSFRGYLCKICQSQFDDIKPFLKHLENHCSINCKVDCPVKNCNLKYGKSNVFRNHINRCHTILFTNDVFVDESYKVDFTDPYNLNTIINNDEDHEDNQSFDSHENIPKQEKMDFEHKFAMNAAKFIMKLTSINIVPISTIDNIISEFYLLHKQSLDNLSGNLTNCQTKDLLLNDPFHKTFGPQGVLRSQNCRKNFYEKNFSVNKVTEEVLYEKTNGKNVYNYLVKPSDIIVNYLKNPKLKQDISKNLLKPSAEEYCLHDISDGSLFKNNEAIAKNGHLGIILFQDAFTAVSPIGSASNLKTYKLVKASYLVYNHSSTII